MLASKKIYVVRGGSGVGKTVVIKYIESLGVQRIVTHTTRKPRDGEINKKSYYFVSVDEFRQTDKIEEAIYDNELYGVSKFEFYKKLEKYDEICVVLEDEGAKFLKAKYPQNVVIISIEASEDIVEQRLKGRNDGITDVERRISNSKQNRELDSCGYADYIIINTDLEETFKEIRKIINK